MKENKNKEEKAVIKYTKEAILQSMKYSVKRDVLNVMLEDQNEYTIEEVDAKLKEFMEGAIVC